MAVILFFGVFITRTLCHTITRLDVPRWADPRNEAQLHCHYTKQHLDPALHSVKWYRGTHEIFRYTPQEFETRSFNNSGISITNNSCDLSACVITLKPEPGTAKYTCEVSSEGPRFALDRQSANMTLSVLPEYEPLITGLPTFVNAGEQALVNCTSDYSLPAAIIDWFVDSEPQEDPVITGITHVSGADGDGLRASWRTLHVFPDDYATHRGYLALQCRATLPTRPPHVRSMAVRLFVASRPHISSYMLSKNTRTLCHTITRLDVPRWADPRNEAQLHCHYTKQHLDPALHSVKWYRGTHEIFRYTPQEFETRSFNNSGISITNNSCDLSACVITLKPEPGTAKYTCEVSSEGPRFALDRQSANMTLSVLPEYEPLITGLPTFVNAGEQALVNCTSDYSLPAAIIDWFVDSEPQEDPVITGITHVSGADGDGLRASWRTLHVFPDDYATHRGYLALQCRATLPTRPPHVRSMAVRLFVASRPHISSYMLSKNNAVGKSSAIRLQFEMSLWTLLLVARRQVPFLVK